MQIRVETMDLESLVSGLSGLLCDLGNAGEVRSLSGAPAENAPLEDAIGMFISQWSENVELLEQALRGLMERLGAAADGYERQEQGVSDGFAV
jgi:hypothetical protein